MRILGIETSCDETAAAIVEDGRKVLSNVIASQIDIHAKTGGVVPEVAAREHVIKVRPVVEEAMKNAGLEWEQIDAIAVTQGPGLLSSLIIGYASAEALAWGLKKPLIPVSHIAGHIFSTWLELTEEVVFPVMTLTVSGGHNELVLQRAPLEFELIGETLDDAAGEAFDKVARILGLGYPGGPAIARAALDGNREAIAFPRAMINSGDFNFSFSGLKTAVLNYVEEVYERNGELSEKVIGDVAASFEECVADILSEKLLRAARKYCVNEIHLVGGVSANKHLREMLERKNGGKLVLRNAEKIVYCTDNAAMIAGVAYQYWKRGREKYMLGNMLADGKIKREMLPDPQLNIYEKA